MAGAGPFLIRVSVFIPTIPLPICLPFSDFFQPAVVGN